MKSQKLLIFHPALAPYRIDFFNSLAANFNASLYFFNDNLLNQKFDQQKIRQDLIFEPKFLKKGFNLPGRSFRYGVLSIIKSENPDIVIGPEYNPVVLFILLARFITRKKFRIFIMCDDNVHVAKNSSVLRRVLRRFVTQRIDGVILTHPEIKDWYERNLNPKAKVFVFPLIREEHKYLSQLIQSQHAAEGYMKDYNLSGKKILLFVGRLTRVKNLERLIEAFEMIYEEDKDLVLVIVGAGELDGKIKQILLQRNLSRCIIMPGRLEGSSLLAWYSVAHIFILPSTYEPFGAVVNEALLAGCYSLVSELAGAASLIEENVNGNILNPFDIVSMANTIKSAIRKEELFLKSSVSRKSLMQISYSDAINELVHNLRR